VNIEQTAEAGLGFLLGYILGFLFKKALKVALIIIAAVVIVNLIIHGDSIAEKTQELDQIRCSADKFMVQNKTILEKIRDFLTDRTITAIAFVAGAITGLLKG